MDSRAPSPTVIEFDAFLLDEASGELRERGVLRRLHPQALRVLLLLAGRPGQIVTRQEIRHCLWGERKYVDFESGINLCVNQIRSALHDSAESSRYVQTLPRRGYRFTASTTCRGPAQRQIAHVATAVEVHPTLGNGGPSDPISLESSRSRTRVAAVVILGASLAILGGDTGWHPQRAAPLMTKDTLVVAEFANKTGDAIFDDALKQALIIELRQPPFLTLLPDSKVRETLKLMKLPADDRITPEIGREICLRTGSAAVLDGKISTLGSHYLLSINATACSSGAALSHGQVEAADREDVLKVLGRSASELHAELSASLSSVQRFDTLVEVTTSSLEALQSYSVGLKVAATQGDGPSIPFFKRAIELDPNFSMAYAALAGRYNNLNQPSEALKYATKGYELRHPGSERERLLIETRFLRMTGELEKHTQTLQMWIAEYPRDASPHGSLGSNYVLMGQYAKALEEWQKALGLNPNDVAIYENLAPVYLALNRLDEAHETLKLALARKLDSSGLRWAIYDLAFVQRDFAQMQQQLNWALGRPGTEDILLSAQSDTEAYFGRVNSARTFSRSAADSAIRSDYKEAAALWQVNAALREAEFGEITETRNKVAEALALDSGRNVKVFAALALARAGETAKAEAIANELQSEYPANTQLIVYRLPSIRTAIALATGNPLRALKLLEPVGSYELAEPSPSGLAPLYPTYLRGLAYLSLRNGTAAAAEFQRILDHPGIGLNFPLAILAHLQLARSNVLARDTLKARSEYLDFLTTWKDADPGIPVLVAARSEFAKLNLRAAMNPPPPQTARVGFP
jgi:DNA-binding winged helix-turn-helix (wHTH) protein/tetratricopeptide (TPR) repeat protein